MKLLLDVLDGWEFFFPVMGRAKFRWYCLVMSSKEGVWFHTWTWVPLLPCLVSVCQRLSQCGHTSTTAELRFSGASATGTQGTVFAFQSLFFFCLLWVSFCWPFSAFPFLLLFLGCQFKCISKTFIQHFYFCSKKDRVSLAHFLVKKYILNLACCFLKATIINKLKIPFYCKFLVNTILTEICLILWMHLIEHLYFFILKWTINAKINIVNMNVFHKLDPLCIYYCLVSF